MPVPLWKADRYLETGSTDAAYNLAFEQYVLENVTRGNVLILWQNDNTVVIGQNQNAAQEVNLPFVRENGIRVVRRLTGGGAVFHDMGNLNYSLIADRGGNRQLSDFCEAIVHALHDLGIDAQSSGRNDIVVQGRKIGGSAQRLYRNRILFHGTLIFDSDISMMSSALLVDRDKFASKGAKSVRSRVGRASDFLPAGTTLASFWAAVRRSLVAETATAEALGEGELHEVAALRSSRYATWDWTWGSGPEYTYRNRKRFPGGTVEVRILAAHGRIEDIVFYGDFLSLVSLDPLCDALRGCQLEQSQLSKTLSCFDLSSFFGSVSLNEILEVMGM